MSVASVFSASKISVAGREQKIGNRLRAQFRFESLRLGCAEVERLKKSVGSDRVRQVVVKIGQADGNAVLPELLPDADVPAKIVLRVSVRNCSRKSCPDCLAD